ncbi:MAG: hypothetical protein ABJF88_04910 [Rhodothermales bacterium]
MTAAAPADLLRRTSRPLPAPPRRSRFLPWALFALIWALAVGLFAAGAQVAAALGS